MSNASPPSYDEVVLGRRSIRGYLDKPVPRGLIEEIITLATRAPSSMNTQPWHFHVITGEPLDRIRRGNTDNILAGVPDSREFRRGGAFAGVHRERQIGVAKQLFEAMRLDKKVSAGEIKFVLARRIGKVEYGIQVPAVEIEAVLDAIAA